MRSRYIPRRRSSKAVGHGWRSKAALFSSRGPLLLLVSRKKDPTERLPFPSHSIPSPLHFSKCPHSPPCVSSGRTTNLLTPHELLLPFLLFSRISHSFRWNNLDLKSSRFSSHWRKLPPQSSRKSRFLTWGLNDSIMPKGKLSVRQRNSWALAF